MPLKVGVVGLSGIGNRHAQCHSKDELVDLVAVCDIDRKKADETAAKHGCKAYYSVAELLAGEPDLDVVDVATGGNENGSWHFQPVMEALAAGKHTLVEKPLSSDIEEARKMVALADEKGVYFGCNLNHYFTPPAERARKYIDDGDVGEIRYCLMKMSFSGGEALYGGPPGSPRVKGFPYFHAKAFLTHPFSVMRYLCGDVTHVQAYFGRPGFRQAAGEVLLSHTSIHLRFVNEATGYLLSNRGDTPTGLGGWWSIEVGGTKGTLCIENCIEKVTFWKAQSVGLGQEPEHEVTESGIKDFDQTFPRRLHAFMEDVTNKVPRERLRGSGRDALAALEYTFAAMESHELGGALVRPHPLPTLRGL
ncbi:MAG TPA: Gfo/Idh/MocA family oxidoreductase [Limnochordia bacterium]|nr:Gfo/Idh/MocA family oxidoreductase [Limnochordia bacterium]